MRADRRSLRGKAVAKLRREGIGSLLAGGVLWATRRARTAVELAARRRLRRARYRLDGRRAIPDLERILEVDPARVTHLVPFSRFETDDPRALLGAVRCGDWDRDLPRIADQPKFRACKARVEEGVPWEETGVVEHLARELRAGDDDAIEHGCTSRADLVDLYTGQRESLYRTLARDGYRRDLSPVCCRVHIGREGEVLFGDGGTHRLYLSKVLGIESVPVRVLCRHCEWQDVREAVARANAVDELSERGRDALDHPDLAAVSVDS